MSAFHLAAGRHSHRKPPFSFLPWLGEQAMERRVCFGYWCSYDTPAYNADDVNKLFGLSFGFGGVHGNSARFGWRWSKRLQAIELIAYCYTAGQRNWDEQMRFPVVAVVKLGQRVTCRVSVPSSGYFQFEVWDEAGKAIQQTGLIHTAYDLPGYGLTHGLWFGGVLTAAHDMTVQIDRT